MKTTDFPVRLWHWIVFGDSWSAAREADTGRDAGWTTMLGIPRGNNFAVSGSTARDWADDKGGCLTAVLTRACEIDGPIVFSLVGNDIRHAADDGWISAAEMLDAYRAVRRVLNWLPRNRHLVMLMYCDPYFGKSLKARIGVALMNRICRLASHGYPAVQHIYTATIFKPEDFDGKDFHPTHEGWKRLARVLPPLVNVWGIRWEIRKDKLCK